MQEDGDRGLHEEEERDEEEMYVLLDLASLGRLKLAENIMPGQTIQLQGLDTYAPTITLADGTVAEGCYEDTVGTCLVLEEPRPGGTTAIGGAQGSDIGGSGGGGQSGRGQLKYLCQTEKLLIAQLPSQRKQPTRTTLQPYS
mmetsp:Transcript_14889/g.44948  ORF Transcript_14889/g.44948 Transcript_14889/m.44948 type:complete len:142 (-) Transcript_14889:2595-3020(-)